MLNRTTWNWHSVPQISFGPGAIGTLSAVVARQEAKRVLVVTDPNIKSAGLVAMPEFAIKQSGAEAIIFDQGEVLPSTVAVETLASAWRDAEPDLVVALGGGSVMDLAKAAKAVVETERDVQSLFGFDNVPRPRTSVPMVCVPTTAGTGSEVSHLAMIKNENQKSAILSQRLRPDFAIVDPQLTLGCPEDVTSTSGIIALSNAIEAMLVTNFYSFKEDFENGLPYEGNHPCGDLHASRAISLIAGSIKQVVADPQAMGPRSAMSLAALYAGLAFSNCGVSLMYALEYPIGARYGSDHGATFAILLPEVLRFWLSVREKRIAEIASLLETASEDMSQTDAGKAAFDWVESLVAKLPLAKRLAELGASENEVPEIAEAAAEYTSLLDLSPRPVELKDLEGILLRCL